MDEMISRSAAKKKYKLTDEQLDQLKHHEVPNRRNAHRPIRLYDKATVIYIGLKSREAQKAKASVLGETLDI